MQKNSIATDVYLTIQEIAERLRVDEKTVREHLISGRKVQFLTIGRKILVDRRSYLGWEELNKTTVRRF
jgi:excisionase family DNA binding protein